MEFKKKITEVLNYVNQNSKFYQKLFKTHQVDISTINTIEDLSKIPFTTKDDLARFNEDFLCVDKNKIVDYVSTSGTLSNPVSFYLTENDLNRLGENEKKSYQLIGADENDVFQMLVTMDKQFMAGLAYYLGVRKIKAGVIRQGPGSPKVQIETMFKFKSTVLIAIPSFIIKIIDYALKNNIDLNQSNVKSILCIGEPIRNENLELNELGRQITKKWNVKLFSTYASTEMGTAFTECTAGKGGHLNDDFLILEVIKENGKLAENGEIGEVVATTLGVEGMPLIRYKTGDLCRVYYEKCSCGLSTPRLGPVIGRKQQMIKFKGTTIFPPAIFNVLAQKNITDYQVVIAKNNLGLDEVQIHLPNELNTPQNIKTLKSAFKSELRVTPLLIFKPEKEIKETVYKFDKRKPEKIVFLHNS